MRSAIPVFVGLLAGMALLVTSPGCSRREPTGDQGTSAETSFAYGPAPDQHASLRLPVSESAGTGPSPVVVLIHGGCWSSTFDRSLMTPLAEAFCAEGFAVWTLEYRRLGQPGGGWPGTFTDIGDGIEALRQVPSAVRLDLSRVVLVGHSAGGQLALGYAAAPRRCPEGPLHRPNPLPVRGVVALAAVTDLLADDTACGNAGKALLGDPAHAEERARQVSPLLLPPFGIRQRLVHGGEDGLVPLAQSRHYYDRARAAGDDVRLEEIAGADHFALITPGSKAWASILAATRELAGNGP